MKKRIFSLIALTLAFTFLLCACSAPEEPVSDSLTETPSDLVQTEPETAKQEIGQTQEKQPETKESSTQKPQTPSDPAQLFATLPAFDGSSAFVIIKDNAPSFSPEEITTKSFESYSSLDALGRCGVAFACIGRDLMPTDDRSSIGQIKPSGWQTVKYDEVDGKYLYNRCHLIGFQLTGENANERNLITGTRFLNIDGMLPFENMVADYIQETGNHVMYRVTPMFENDNLLCSGVFMEAYSVEDQGEGISFHVYCYNAQPKIDINYKNGDSALAAVEEAPPVTTSRQPQSSYVLNTNTKKIHKPHCPSAEKISPKNRQTYEGSLDPLYAQGYQNCKNCF